MDTLTKSEMIDLVAFSALGRTRTLQHTEPIVRSFDALIYTNEANRRLNRTVPIRLPATIPQ